MLAVRPRTWAILLPALALLAVATVVLLESETSGHLLTAAGLGMRSLVRLGPPASFVALYLEESGVPLPISGDVFVVYLGHHFAGSVPGLVLAWLGLVVTVVAGSSTLYFVSRRWGRRLAEGRLGMLMHLTPARLAISERWFRRWGVPAIVFGRHVFGCRVPITVAAGVCRVPYPIFAASVTASTAVWAAIWLWLGVAFGRQLAHLLTHHHWVYALLLTGVALFAGLAVLARSRQLH